MRLALVTQRTLPHLAPDDRLLIAPLRKAGIEARGAVWDSPAVEWSGFDAAVLRSCWDYHEHAADFRAWIDRVSALGVQVWNPPRLLHWNMDKRYLRELERLGAPIAPTEWIDQGSAQTLAEVLARRAWRASVIKPVVSANGTRTWRIPGAPTAADEQAFAELVAERDVMVQCFVPAIETSGEWSFVFIDGIYSHAAIKRPRPGDFRVQTRHGGRSEPAEPPRGLIEQAEAVMRLVPSPTLYARVDACAVHGELVLMELEALEPSLFLDFVPHAPRRFAGAIARVLRAA